MTVLKIGGALVDDAEALGAFWHGVKRLLDDGQRAVVVHGGGPQSSALTRRLGGEPRMVAGRRVTGDLDLDVTAYAIRGKASAALVASARTVGVDAVGIAGLDGGLVQVTRRPPVIVDGETVDFGHVGDVTGANVRLLDTLLDAGFVPVVSPLCADAHGNLLNVNADTVACTLAEALHASAFRLVTETGGVRRHADDPASHLDALDAATVEAGIRDGWIAGGMRPKLDVAMQALRAGIPDVSILAPDNLLTGTGGTTVRR